MASTADVAMQKGDVDTPGYHSLIHHMSLSVADFDGACAFYTAVLAALGARTLMEIPAGSGDHTQGIGMGRDRPDFWLMHGGPQPPGHIAFAARSRAEVEAFHAAGLATGGTDNGAPGLRPQYHPDYYAAFVIDPEGLNIEAVTFAPA